MDRVPETRDDISMSAPGGWFSRPLGRAFQSTPNHSVRVPSLLGTAGGSRGASKPSGLGTSPGISRKRNVSSRHSSTESLLLHPHHVVVVGEVQLRLRVDGPTEPGPGSRTS